MADQQIAVLIDYENVGLNSIQWLFDQISDFGRVIVKRAYADWSAASNKGDQLLELGIEPIHLFHTGGSGKNASDIRLAIDAIDLLYQSPVDTLVIVSSDSDFAPLVSKLRAAGKTIIGAGWRATASRTLVISCDRYFFLDQGSKSQPQERASQTLRTDSLLLRAVKATMDDQGKVVGSRLHQTMLRLDPSFDFRALGYSTFTRYLEASPEVKVIRPRGRGDVTVEVATLNEGRAERRAESENWAPLVDEAWARRAPAAGHIIAGSAAAADAAVALGVSKLSASPYKTLQRLLDASDQLSSRWQRDGNSIIRRMEAIPASGR